MKTEKDFERLLNRQELRVSAAKLTLSNAKTALAKEQREYERIRLEYAKMKG